MRTAIYSFIIKIHKNSSISAGNRMLLYGYLSLAISPNSDNIC